MIDTMSSYNVILGRPCVHLLRRTPSPYHQQMRFQNIDPYFASITKKKKKLRLI